MQELKQQERQRLSDRPWSRRSRTSEAAVSGMGVRNSNFGRREVDRNGQHPEAAVSVLHENAKAGEVSPAFVI